jgi:hypothetical protein
MLEKRAHQRRKIVLPVKVSIGNACHLAHTLDISYAGVRLGGLRTQLQPGQTISLQRGSQKARFRIVWNQQLGPNEIQVGVESLEPQNSFLGVDLSEQEPAGNKKNVDMLLTVLSGRQKSDDPQQVK